MTICYCLYNRCQFRPAVFCHVISKLNQKEWVSTVNILLILKQKTNRNSWCWIKFVLMLWSFFAWPMSQSYAWWHEAFDECFAMFSVFQCWIPVLVGFACVCAVDFPSVQTDVVLEALLLQRWCIFLRVITFVPWNALKLFFFFLHVSFSKLLMLWFWTWFRCVMDEHHTDKYWTEQSWCLMLLNHF